MADSKNPARDKNDPSCTSADYQHMEPIWNKIRAILGGLHSVRACGKTYLPKYEAESEAEYKRRLASTTWRPEFEDGLRNLSAKPFQKDITVGDKASQQIKDFAEDVDGQGNNLTRFSKDTFDNALSYGVEGILVDYPSMAPGITLADERAVGARPYWTHLNATNIIALYFDVVGGNTIIKHLRYRECYTEQDGFGEKEIERIRVFEMRDTVAWFQVWESVPDVAAAKKAGEATVMLVQEGPISLKTIPVALFFTGKRYGNYSVKPPLESLADMQIELYQSLSRKEEILTYSGAPMLKVIGVDTDSLPTRDDGEGNKVPYVQTGPKISLMLSMNQDGKGGDADYIQPSADNIRVICDDINNTIENMRRLAMQPITDKSGNPTATGQAIDQAKAHSTLQSWALGLKDALEVAFKYTAQWMQLNEEPEVQVFTDFGVDATGVEEAAVLQKDAQSGQISRRTYWAELQRRDILSAEFDADAEEELISQQGGALGDMVDPNANPNADPNANGGEQQQEAA